MVRGDLLIDDCFDNVKRFIKMDYEQHGILCLQPWNILQYLDFNNSLIGVNSWTTIDKWIQFIDSEK